ncbi:MAG: tol-pal system protein YbgF [Thiomicrorhabdus sp.]|nr:tol-pal system protein YbgF [Thiomicrorhabdus sp.]
MCVSWVMLSSSIVFAATPESSVEDRLQRIERIIENPVLLQLSRRLGEQQREIQDLQDQIDYLKRDLRKINRVADKRYKENDDRLSHLENATEDLANQVPVVDEKIENDALVSEIDSNERYDDGVGGEKNPQKEMKKIMGSDASASTLTPVKTHPATSKEQATYQLAFALIKKGQYDASIQAFQSFLNRYPNSELASNSAYWMGEAHYIQKDNQAALKAFNVVIKRYPSSSKTADAMLRAGDCLENLKQLKKAKNMYNQLITLHSGTSAAEKAIKRLEKL